MTKPKRPGEFRMTAREPARLILTFATGVGLRTSFVFPVTFDDADLHK